MSRIGGWHWKWFQKELYDIENDVKNRWMALKMMSNNMCLTLKMLWKQVDDIENGVKLDASHWKWYQKGVYDIENAVKIVAWHKCTKYVIKSRCMTLKMMMVPATLPRPFLCAGSQKGDKASSLGETRSEPIFHNHIKLWALSLYHLIIFHFYHICPW